jgi:streptogramin lyase
MAYDFGRVWVAPIDEPRTIERIDPVSRAADPKLFRMPKGTTGRLATGFGDLWVPVAEHTWHLVAMDPESGHVRCDAKTGIGYNVAAGEDAVWVSNFAGLTVSRVDPRNCTSETIHLPGIGGSPSGIGLGFGYVWVADSQSGVVYKIDQATHKVVDRIRVSELGSGYQSDIVALSGSMWVASPVTDTIERIDPITGPVRSDDPPAVRTTRPRRGERQSVGDGIEGPVLQLLRGGGYMCVPRPSVSGPRGALQNRGRSGRPLARASLFTASTWWIWVLPASKLSAEAAM